MRDLAVFSQRAAESFQFLQLGPDMLVLVAVSTDPVWARREVLGLRERDRRLDAQPARVFMGAERL